MTRYSHIARVVVGQLYCGCTGSLHKLCKHQYVCNTNEEQLPEQWVSCTTTRVVPRTVCWAYSGGRAARKTVPYATQTGRTPFGDAGERYFDRSLLALQTRRSALQWVRVSSAPRFFFAFPFPNFITMCHYHVPPKRKAIRDNK